VQNKIFFFFFFIYLIIIVLFINQIDRRRWEMMADRNAKNGSITEQARNVHNPYAKESSQDKIAQAALTKNC